MNRRLLGLPCLAFAIGVAAGFVSYSPWFWLRVAAVYIPPLTAAAVLTLAVWTRQHYHGGKHDADSNVQRAGGRGGGGDPGAGAAVAATKRARPRAGAGARPRPRVVIPQLIVGVRGFYVRLDAQGVPWLWSQAMDVCWAGPELVARHVDLDGHVNPADDHFAPRKGCDCGIHVCHNVNDSRMTSGGVLAAVACSGVVIRHGYGGLRVERARILALALPDPRGHLYGDAGGGLREVSISDLAARYGVPVVDRDYLIPYACETTGGIVYTPGWPHEP